MTVRSLRIVSGVIFAALAIVSCKHVSLEPDAATVLVIGAEDAAACKRLGKTKVEVLAKVLFVKRSEEKMSGELATLARNAALDMGGNAVVAESAIEGGKQTFGIYACAED